MKKFVYGILILITAFIFLQCEKEKMIPGEVGIPVYLVPEAITSSDTSGCTFNWSFEQKPTTSALNILSFQPSNNGYNIYFIPDVSGDFHVKCAVMSTTGKLKQESIYLCKIKPNPTAVKKPVVSGTVSEKTPELAPVYLEDAKTQEPAKIETPKYEPEKIVEQKPVVKPRVKVPVAPAKEDGLYTIQISSFRTYANAEKELNELKNMGMQDIFIKKTYIKSKDEVWYRIRTSSYATMTDARSVLNEIKTKYRRKSAWIDKIN